MTELGRYTGVARDELALVSDSVRNDLGGAVAVSDVGGLYCRYNMRRLDAISDLAALTTQVMTSAGIFLRKGDVVTSLTFASGGTAAGTPTNWWFALYSAAATPALVSQTADQLTAAWAANTAMTKALAAAYTVPSDGWYFAAVMVKATTVPTLAGANPRAAAAGAILSASYGEKALAVTSGASLVATAPATIATPTTVGTVPLVIVS